MAFSGAGQFGKDDPADDNDDEKEISDTEYVFPFSVAAARIDPFYQDKGRGNGIVQANRKIPGICEGVEYRVDQIVRVHENNDARTCAFLMTNNQ